MHSGTDGRRQRSVHTRAQILDAAETLFATTGYRATSLRSIAREVGITHAGVLAHFPSKEALLVAVMLRMEEASHAVGQSVGFDSLNPIEQLLVAADHIAASGNALRLFVTLIGEATSPAHPGHEPLQERFSASLQGFTAGFGPAGERLLGGWLGLQLLSLYLPDRVDISALLAEQIDRVLHPLPEAARAPADLSTIRVDAGTAPAPPTRRDEIVAAASDLFARTGYGATSVREIAASLGTSHSALRYYFPDKESLLSAVLEARDARSATIPAEQPLDLLHGLYLRSTHNDQLGLYSVLVCEATDPSHPAHEYFRDSYVSLINTTVAEFEKLTRLGLARPGVDAERFAIWALAQRDGLRIHSSYGGTTDIAPAMLASLDETLLVALPPAVEPRAA